MSSSMAATDTTYTQFSRDEAYVEANRAFVAGLPLGDVRRILDLACGTGAVGQCLLAAAPQASLHGIDLDPVQIGLAARNYAELGHRVYRPAELPDADPCGPPGSVTLTVGSAEHLPFADASFDGVVIANAIHLIADKRALASSIARVLRPDGLFAFNSGFYAGCWPQTTQRVYYEWLKEATAWIARRNAERVAAGLQPLRRLRGKSQLAPVAYQNRWLAPDEWRALLRDCGFRVHDVHERRLMFDEASLSSVGAYSGLAEAQLSGYPVELASQALKETAGAALDSAGVRRVQHNWIEVCAFRHAAVDAAPV